MVREESAWRVDEGRERGLRGDEEGGVRSGRTGGGGVGGGDGFLAEFGGAETSEVDVVSFVDDRDGTDWGGEGERAEGRRNERTFFDFCAESF